ncbi:PucR family transcriptional regulator [Streptomyces sp. NPDC059009]|uniref:PucR family transcriptional regulator n=1 Tax=Streptomyces sp. NPDC059009 TaxID=3346694 RepID=UPI0036AF92A0
MHVDHLLQLEELGLRLLWGEPPLLAREISGVTTTDLQDPVRFLQSGEIVLSALVWWNLEEGAARTERFVSALRTAGAVALLAGEEHHGTVPEHVVKACREHRIPLLAVPAHTTFRAITETVYLRQWGDLSRRSTDHHALPENVRAELGRLLDRNAPTAELLDRAFAPLGPLPCYLFTATGRTLARTQAAPALSARKAAASLARGDGFTLRVDSDATPYDSWHLHLPGATEAPPRVLHDIAEVIAQHRAGRERHRTARRRAADHLATLVAAPTTDATALESALTACALPPAQGPYRVLSTTLTGTDGPLGAEAAAALSEALGHLPGARFAVGRLPHGEAIAVLQERPEPTGPDDRTTEPDEPDGTAGPDASTPTPLTEIWPLLHACAPDSVPHGGLSTPAAGPTTLNSALTQARYARAAATATDPHGPRVTAVQDITALAPLLAGVPEEVRTIYRTTVLGPLVNGEQGSRDVLLETLKAFLAHDCSWARTAEALHVHVNTVHYRVQRIEALTGRDLSRLDHKLDLYAALLAGGDRT